MIGCGIEVIHIVSIVMYLLAAVSIYEIFTIVKADDCDLKFSVLVRFIRRNRRRRYQNVLDDCPISAVQKTLGALFFLRWSIEKLYKALAIGSCC